jgi:LysM repeat protein
MFRNILTTSFFLALAFIANAQTIYLTMDQDCVDRMEYASGDSDNPYISYSVKLGDKRFVSFDVGIESKKWESALPGKLTRCSSVTFNRDFVQKVNNGSIKLYAVRESPTHYHIAPIEKASLIETSGNNLEVMGGDASFSLNMSNPISGVNLALPGSKSEVYLEGTINYQCLRGYILQKKESSDSRSFKEYIILPEMGIVERASIAKTGFVDDIIRDNEYRLAKIDDILFKSVISEVCDNVQARYYDGQAMANNQKLAEYDNLTPKTGTATPTAYGSNDPCSPSTDPNLHVIQKGETLYALSRKYGVSVAQLQEWNNLADGNVISLCQKLWVRQPSKGSSTGTTTTTTSTEKGGDATTSNAGYWNKATAEHQVRPGETVASLAKMYGYTEERFRKMNGLSPTETLRQGQRLRTNDCNCPTLETSTKDTPLPYEEQSGAITSKDGTSTQQRVIDNKDVYYRPITVHLVKSTDTWYSIAKLYNTSVERILELNGMTKDDKLTTDQRIYVQ